MEAIYARQSVEKLDSLSIQGQIDLCKQQTSGGVKIYEDKGFSGKNTKRPAFQAMMQDVKAGHIQKIVVYRLDRFSRSISDFSRLWEILQEYKVEFVSVNETFDTATPMGRAMLNIIMIFAQLERETTAQRVRDNYYQRAKLGSWPGGPAPYGFSLGRLPDATGHSAPSLVPNEQIGVVERIFEGYAQGEASLGTVARMLGEEGVSAPRREVWDNVSISRILHSPLYVMADEDIYLYYKGKGLIFANEQEEFDGVHAAMVVGKRDRNAKKYTDLQNQHLSLCNHYGVIPSDIWLRCQYKLEQNKQLGGNGRGNHTWLSGLLKYAKCGYSVKVNRDKQKYYLICSGRSNYKVCDASIKAPLRELEMVVTSELEKLLSQCPPLPEQNTAEGETLRELSAIEEKIERLMDALAQSDDVSMVYVNRTIAKLEKKRQSLVRGEKERKQKALPMPSTLKFESLSFGEKKIVAQQFIEKIKLQGRAVEIVWKI